LHDKLLLIVLSNVLPVTRNIRQPSRTRHWSTDSKAVKDHSRYIRGYGYLTGLEVRMNRIWVLAGGEWERVGKAVALWAVSEHSFKRIHHQNWPELSLSGPEGICKRSLLTIWALFVSCIHKLYSMNFSRDVVKLLIGLCRIYYSCLQYTLWG